MKSLVQNPPKVICDTCQDNNPECQDCCVHEFDPDEGYMCLNCGMDGTEHMADYADYLNDLALDK